jgi:hypothetical protein
MYFDGEIPDYRLIGTLNPDKTPETPDLSGLTSLDCNSMEHFRLHLFIKKPLHIHFRAELKIKIPYPKKLQKKF